jgi:hypothetical protein
MRSTVINSEAITFTYQNTNERSRAKLAEAAGSLEPEQGEYYQLVFVSPEDNEGVTQHARITRIRDAKM